jgi:arginine-tRNA-protein transferase
MDDPNPERYMEFLTSEWSITRFAEFRLDGKLLAVAVMDMLEDGISAVYTYFDPDYDKRSLGTLAILWEIEWVKQQNLPWLYLGYWIEECAKMRYKSQFLPHQKFIQGNWV